MNSAFNQKFPKHELFRDDKFWSASTSSFNSKAANTRIHDSNIVDTRSSQQLYRKNSPNFLRKKWREINLIDAVSGAFVLHQNR